MKVRVAVNGYGTVGKRVARAVSLQNDMELVGVTLTKPSFKAIGAKKEGFDVYSVGEKFSGAAGTLADLLKKCDIVVDCNPGDFGPANRKIYEKAGVKAVFQGGEEPGIADVSFNANVNFEKAKGKRFLRVVSCNTTGLCRSINALKPFGVQNVYAVVVRRAVDPNNSSKGPINAIVPEMKIPSHHGVDVKTIMPELSIVTAAVKVPTTLMHVHTVSVMLANSVQAADVLRAFENENRVIVVEEKSGIKSTAELMEYAKDLGRDRGDLYEIAVWKESVNVKGNVLYYMQAVHQESDIVPENVDAIRAVMGICGQSESISRTNKSMGIL